MPCVSVPRPAASPPSFQPLRSRTTLFAWMSRALPAPGVCGTPWLVIIVVIIGEAVFILSILKLVVQGGKFFVVLLLVHVFLQAFKGRFARLFFVGLDLIEGCRSQLFLSVDVSIIINRGDISR